MTRFVLKYPVPVADSFVLRLPIGARIVRFAPQGESLYLWALVDRDREEHERHFGIRGTGHPWEGDDNYVASCEHGAFVWHLVEGISF